MKIIVSMLAGLLSSFAAIELIGFLVAIPAPAWSRWYAHLKTWRLRISLAISPFQYSRSAFCLRRVGVG
jgi:hypothetical protein